MRRILLLFFAVLVLAGLPAVSQPTPSMTAHFINVGQAHSTLLEFSCGAVLIDAGAQDDTSQITLLNYLNVFFKRRSDLSRTLDLVLIRHNHIDHTRALRQIIETEKIAVRHYVDNGFTTGSGRFNPNWLKAEVQAGRLKTSVRTVPDSDVEAAANKTIGNINAGFAPVVDRMPLMRPPPSASTVPVAGRPFAFWNAMRARRRFAPARPSISPGEKPARSSITCAATTSLMTGACANPAGGRSRAQQNAMSVRMQDEFAKATPHSQRRSSQVELLCFGS